MRTRVNQYLQKLPLRPYTYRIVDEVIGGRALEVVAEERVELALHAGRSVHVDILRGNQGRVGQAARARRGRPVPVRDTEVLGCVLPPRTLVRGESVGNVLDVTVEGLLIQCQVRPVPGEEDVGDVGAVSSTESSRPGP